jgi:hypothetical protein
MYNKDKVSFKNGGFKEEYAISNEKLKELVS